MIYNPWPHQIYSVDEVFKARAAGIRRICLMVPTGGGKTWIAEKCAELILEKNGRVILYTNRKMLVEQTKKHFEKRFEVGVRAAGYEDQRYLPLQISSMQTETRRLKKPEENRGWALHDADLVIVDEAHLQSAGQVQSILTQHVEKGATILGLTATPIDLGCVYDHLIIGANYSQLRACGAMVPFVMYGPDEPDLKNIKAVTGEDPSEKEARKVMMNATIFGRVLKWYRKLNQQMKPTLGFAPGCDESYEFARQFTREGINAAHIDGEVAWWNGRFYRNSKTIREDILEAHRCGDIKVIWNRFVLREGVDAPWVEHLILATVIGSPQTFVQTIGRGGRGCPSTGKTQCIVQDHGGSWHRPGLGDPNADREWNLDWTAGMIAGMDEQRQRKEPRLEPYRCPECAEILRDRNCSCGYELKPYRRSRIVVQIDGTLKKMEGSVFKKKTIDASPTAAQKWKSMYFRFLNTDKTFSQAMGCYCYENNWQWPPPDAPFMPIEPIDFFLKVKDVPRSRLIQENSYVQSTVHKTERPETPTLPGILPGTAAVVEEPASRVVPDCWRPPRRPAVLRPE